MKKLITLLFVLGTLSCAGQKTIDFAESMIGQKVGDGVCQTLVMEALRYDDPEYDTRESLYTMLDDRDSSEVDMPYFGEWTLEPQRGDIVVYHGVDFGSGKSEFHVGIVAYAWDRSHFISLEQNVNVDSLDDSVVEVRMNSLSQDQVDYTHFFRP